VGSCIDAVVAKALATLDAVGAVRLRARSRPHSEPRIGHGGWRRV